MKTPAATGKVIWAVDPKPQDKRMQFKAARALAKAAMTERLAIEPVCVLSPDEVGIAPEGFAQGSKSYREGVEKLIRGWIKELKIPNLLEPTILIQNYFSRSNSVSTLLRYAEDTGARLIGVSTHTKKGLEKWLFGSFAEILITQSQTPLMVINPRAPEPKKLDRVLFATDLGDTAKEAFQTFLESPAARRAKVVIAHAVSYVPVETVAWSNAMPDLKQLIEADKKAKQRIGDELCRLAASAGVSASFVFLDKSGTVAELILQEAKRQKASMIAMSSQSGSVTTAIFGSVARQVVRQSSLPVWVIRPRGKTRAKTTPRKSRDASLTA